VLCPRCRGDGDPLDSLDGLPAHRHCSTCNIDFEQDFSANVELTFTPEPWLRPLGEGAFCMMGAAAAPHIRVQRLVPPGEELLVDPPLAPGAYRLRSTQAGPEVAMDWDGRDGFPAVLATRDGGIVAGPPSPPGQVRLVNESGRPLTLVVEETAWRSDALTGDRAIAMPAFRRYCPDQLLRPGDDVAIGRVALMFSDLKGSTSLYEAIGDTAAYNLVRDHFDYLTRLVERHGGVVVKTIGDAVMAAFAEPAEAAAAALAAQAGIADFNAGRADGGITLKLGLHQGGCIAVTTGRRLDYFGSTVNLAARLQGESRGGDIVLSAAMMAEPAVRECLAVAGASGAREHARLRGIAEEAEFWRVTLRPMPSAASA
ncbi:MAG TPA: adenylate/guanylate cyclase domain-containing protein, partial [Alphaproteobacteria bacterium]|nr:adenylate/guanylate cyclase domain-containing protein [Alphaproteobacteria bacterium]